jgi:uncharacterized protein YcfL
MATQKFDKKAYQKMLEELSIKQQGVREGIEAGKQLIGAEPYSDRPLTPQEVEEKQRKQPSTSPYDPGKSPIPSKKTLASLKIGDQKVAMSASDIGQQVLQQRAAESKAGKINRGSRSYVGEDHQRAREIDGKIYWYDEYKHMPFYQNILKKHGHTEELQQIQNEIQQKQSLMLNDLKIAKGKKKRNVQRAYEDFVRDSQNMPLDESFKDLRRGIDREGLDIMKDVLGLDEA